jgi:hypothetical protein
MVVLERLCSPSHGIKFLKALLLKYNLKANLSKASYMFLFFLFEMTFTDLLKAIFSMG